MVEWRTIAVLVLTWSFCCRADNCPKRDDEFLDSASKGNLNDRIKLLESSSYTVSDDKYTYSIHLCKNSETDDVAVNQFIKENSKNVIVGTFHTAQVMGGEDWLMFRYGGGQNYTSHCKGQARLAIVMVTCDQSNDKGTMKVLEEYSLKEMNPFHQCYYLFELVHKAACNQRSSPSSPSGLSPGSTLLIIMISLLLAYIGFGFLYQRFVVGAKGIEQIPNLDFWKDFGNLQADGCNFACRCFSKEPAKYRTMEDALGDDDDGDDNLLPM